MAFENKAPGIQQVCNTIASHAFGMSIFDARRTGVCVKCHQPALANCKTDAGRREYGISGLCEICWDSIMGSEG